MFLLDPIGLVGGSKSSARPLVINNASGTHSGPASPVPSSLVSHPENEVFSPHSILGPVADHPLFQKTYAYGRSKIEALAHILSHEVFTLNTAANGIEMFLTGGAAGLASGSLESFLLGKVGLKVFERLAWNQIYAMAGGTGGEIISRLGIHVVGTVANAFVYSALSSVIHRSEFSFADVARSTFDFSLLHPLRWLAHPFLSKLSPGLRFLLDIPIGGILFTAVSSLRAALEDYFHTGNLALSFAHYFNPLSPNRDDQEGFTFHNLVINSAMHAGQSSASIVIHQGPKWISAHREGIENFHSRTLARWLRKSLDYFDGRNSDTSRRTQKIEVPAPRKASLKAAALAKARGIELKEIIRGGMGQNTFSTADNIREAMSRHALTGDLGYSAVEGIEPLRKAIQKRYNEKGEAVVIGTGGKGVVDAWIQAAFDEGDHLGVFGPCWPYPDTAELRGVNTRIILGREEVGFKVTARELEKFLAEHPDTDGLVITNPQNPAGGVYRPEELSAIAKVIEAHDHLRGKKTKILSDEIYSDVVFSGETSASRQHLSFADLPSMADRTIVLDGFSKAEAAAGVRLCYAFGSPQVIERMVAYQSVVAANPNIIAQMGYLEALNGPRDFVSRQAAEFRERAQYTWEEFGSMGISSPHPEGAFYLFLNIKHLLGKRNRNTNRIIRSDEDFTDFLLEEALVSAVPGSGFSCPGYFRFSVGAENMERLRIGMGRIRDALQLLE